MYILRQCTLELKIVLLALQLYIVIYYIRYY